MRSEDELSHQDMEEKQNKKLPRVGTETVLCLLRIHIINYQISSLSLVFHL